MKEQKLIETATMESRQELSQSDDTRMSPTSANATTEPGALRVRILKTDAELESIREVWQELCQHPHSEPDFFQMVLRTTPGVKSGYVLAVERDGKISTLLAGRLEEMRMDVSLGYLKLPQPKVRALVFIYGGLMGAATQEECEALVEAISGTLKNGSADVVFFNHLHMDSPLFVLLQKRAGFFTRDRFGKQSTHRKITIPVGTDALWKQFQYRARGNFRWNVKTFLKSHADQYSIECLTRPTEVDDLIRKVELVAKKTYQRSLGVGFGASPAELARLRLKAEKGWLQGYVLSIDGEPAAFLCGTQFRGVFHADFMGFDPQYKRTSPGIFLTLQVVEKFCEMERADRIDAMDWGLGDARYKSDLCNLSWEDCSLHLFAPTLRGIVANMYRTPVMLVDRLARKIFDAQVQEKIKSKWRARQQAKKKD
ncbi:MAG TPA: GNAT family N-acetyltransferase [Terracidiphilus sp.]|nr:GNAT family N-acetyltransferase [Terracidiphilus sp.]